MALMAAQQLLAESLRAMHDLKMSSLFSGGQTNGAVTCLVFLAMVFFVTQSGSEISLLYFFIAVTVAFYGPGALSLDALFQRRVRSSKKLRFSF